MVIGPQEDTEATGTAAVSPVAPPLPGDPPTLAGPKPPELPTEPDPVSPPGLPAPGPPIPESSGR